LRRTYCRSARKKIALCARCIYYITLRAGLSTGNLYKIVFCEWRWFIKEEKSTGTVLFSSFQTCNFHISPPVERTNFWHNFFRKTFTKSRFCGIITFGLPVSRLTDARSSSDASPAVCCASGQCPILIIFYR